MVYYIRFLKPPKHVGSSSRSSGSVKAVIAVTTDLGDAFFDDTVELEAEMFTDDKAPHQILSRKKVYWRAGDRAVPIELALPDPSRGRALKLRVSQDGRSYTPLRVDSMPEIVAATSDSFSHARGVPAQRHVARSLDLGQNGILMVWEETGESIARHVWDAALGVVALLCTAESIDPKVSLSHNSPWLSRLCSSSSREEPLRTIELGAGCGIVSLALTQLFANCHSLLTDLPEAVEIMEHNKAQADAHLAQGATLECCVLDWDAPLPHQARQPWDLILVSDCIYNADSHTSLVGTLTSLAALSRDTMVVMATKVRHESEARFFDMMGDAGFGQVGVERMCLPDRTRTRLEIELEQVEIYTFVNKRDRPDL